MDGRSFALALFLLPALSAPAADAPPGKPETRMALTGDFVELGAHHPGVSRKHAAVEIVNRSPHPIDVKLGHGSGRVEPGKTLFVRMDPGEQPLELSSPAAPGDQLAATLTLQKGKSYALGVAWEEVLVGEAPGKPQVPAASGSAAASKAKGEPAPAAKTQTQAAGGKKGAGWEKKTKSGRVDIGRKRKKDR
jgi:hypothetical protein